MHRIVHNKRGLLQSCADIDFQKIDTISIFSPLNIGDILFGCFIHDRFQTKNRIRGLLIVRIKLMDISLLYSSLISIVPRLTVMCSPNELLL